uniref:Ubiquitin carboxyl-terminal hydrolase 36 n=1 Tax=Geospiza parvula TaxID=87175 RepID=A0A8C3MFN8_GEOPR
QDALGLVGHRGTPLAHVQPLLTSTPGSFSPGPFPITGKGMTPPQKTLFPPEKISMDWRQKRRPGAGLYNLGSTCYLNVILQCLTYTPPLANYLLSRQHSRFCSQQGFCMMCIMEDHVRKVLYSSGELLTSFLVIGEFKPDIPGDAYEFLRCTLNAMHTACLSGSNDLDSSSQETSIIHEIFGGFLRSRGMKCLGEGISHSSAAPFSLLQGASSLTTALEDFVKPKEVVEYPEYLDLRPFTSDPAGEPILYSLYAVVVHTGHTCLGGHFFCYTKASNGQWYKMNDVSVDSCAIHTVLGQQAYLLFYFHEHHQPQQLSSEEEEENESSRS